jgi:hypothetical protein
VIYAGRPEVQTAAIGLLRFDVLSRWVKDGNPNPTLALSRGLVLVEYLDASAWRRRVLLTGQMVAARMVMGRRKG